MAALEPLIALLAIVAPLALAGVLVEWMAPGTSPGRPRDLPLPPVGPVGGGILDKQNAR
jgi:hypothetical protein